jgi:predicted Rossmann fold nucleotide-binding protein DprA/Smf involved in DNA uptake
VLLTTRLIARDEQPLSAGEFWSLVDSVDDPAELLDPAVSSDDRVRRLLEAGTALALKLEELERSGVRAVTPYDEGYPERLRERLGSRAPPVLHVAGPIELLAQDGIGIVGSRNVGADAREVASEIARVAVRGGLSVVSGVARGIDQVAMASALEADGTVVGIPADSMNKLVGDPSVRRAITDGRMCVATPFAPSAGFSVGTAMARNKLIYALSRVTVVVTTDLNKGGTWSGAIEALQRGYGTVGVWVGEGAGPGNDELVSRGARAIEDPAMVLDIEADPISRPEREQLRLL